MSDFSGVNLSGLGGDQSLLKHQSNDYAQLLRLRDEGSGSMGHSKTEGATKESLRKASKEFESIFLYQMVTAMRNTVGEGSFIPKSNGQEIFEGMLDEEWSKKLAGQNGRAGLSELLYQQLSRQLGLEDSPEAESSSNSVMPLRALSEGDVKSALLNMANPGALKAVTIVEPQ